MAAGLAPKADFAVNKPKNSFTPILVGLPYLGADPDFNTVTESLFHNNFGIFRKRHFGEKAFLIGLVRGNFGRQIGRTLSNSSFLSFLGLFSMKVIIFFYIVLVFFIRAAQVGL